VTDLPFDFRALARDLREQMERQQKSLRTAAEEIGCSPATLSRVLKGDDSDNLPDTKTLLRAASWMRKGLSDYEPFRGPASASMGDVELHLRALSGLSDKDKEVLVAMVRAAHEQFGSRSKKR
jgi:transcriptional regulator with XRE-family HTH domain